MIDNPNILLVDDERLFSNMTAEYLQARGCVVSLAHSADDGLAAFHRDHFDCCVLDVKMPFKDGFSLAQDIRAANTQVPIIFLTGQSSKEHRIKGFTLGADDYVTKPFSMEELYLRIQAILKRVSESERPSLDRFVIGAYSFDPIARELMHQETVLKLSAIESHLLRLLYEQKNGILQRTYALNRIWQDEDHLKSRSLNVYISKLRSLLKKDQRVEILNVHGEGYRLIVKD